MFNKLLSIIFGGVLSSCNVPTCPHDTNSIFSRIDVYEARITYYSPDPFWGTQVACPKTPTAIIGESVAAHPDFPFGTKIYIPELDGVVGNGYFRVDNRGPAITSKRASRGRAYVFDVYVGCREAVRRMKTAVPDFMTVIVIHSKKS